MTQQVLEALASNSLIAMIIAGLALSVRLKSNWTVLEHALWVIVLVKLITPPLFHVPIPILDPANLDQQNSVKQYDALTSTGEATTTIHLDSISRPALAENGSPIANLSSPMQTTLAQSLSESELTAKTVWLPPWPIWLLTIWAGGSLWTILKSSHHTYAFNQLLRKSSTELSQKDSLLASQTAKSMGLKSTPKIFMTSARISPLVWWVGGHVRIYLPQFMHDEMDNESWQHVLAHEFAHVLRRDYVVRWLEWFAVSLFWWNPLVWIAQHKLRDSEEVCCDGLVLSRLSVNQRDYAETILSVVERLVDRNLCPPVLASEISSGGMLERRIKMVLSGQKTKTPGNRLRLVIALLVMVTVPVGFSLANSQSSPDTDAQTEVSTQTRESQLPAIDDAFEAVKQRLHAAVEAEEISSSEMESMLQVLQTTQSQNQPEWEAATRSFALSLAIMHHSYSRLCDTTQEREHFESLGGIGVQTLDVALDADRRNYQARIAMDTALLENATNLNSLEQALLKAVEAGKLSKQRAGEISLDSEKQLWEAKMLLGQAFQFNVLKNDQWLAKRMLEHAVESRDRALQVWRVMRKQYEAGGETNIQNVAQVQEQFHYFDAAVQEAHGNVRD